MVGYQGLSSRSRNQRKSGANGKATHTGTPSPPARWASAESMLTTRSRLRMTAAVSGKSRSPRSRSGQVSKSGRNCSVPAPNWRLTRRTPGKPASGAQLFERNRAVAIDSILWIALPGYTNQVSWLAGRAA